MGCTFCATGTMGLRANLTAGEIVEQVWHVERTAPSFGVHWRVSNVVFMGMGEPLNNYKPVMGAVRALKELWGMNPSKITISTVGVVNRIKSLASDAHGVSLALSLHAATQATRVKLVPSGSAFTMDKLMSSVDAYIEASGRGVMIEYILIADVNDTDDEAKALADLLLPRSKNVVLNLIPYNRTTAGDSHGYQSPSVEEVRRFAATLSASGANDAVAAEDEEDDDDDGCSSVSSKAAIKTNGLRVSVRWSSAYARDVDGACGQLALLSEGSSGDKTTTTPASRDIEDLVVHTTAASIEQSSSSSCHQQQDQQAGAAAAAATLQYSSCSPMAYRHTFTRSTPLRIPSNSLHHHLPWRHHFKRHCLQTTSQPSPQHDQTTLPPPLPHQSTPQWRTPCCAAATSLPPTTKRDGANHWLKSDARKAFLLAYEDFVRDVILPRVDAATPGHAPCGRLVYQTEPTIRVSLPGQARPPGGKARSSSEHFHQNGELSVWVPLTSSMESGAMHSQRELQAGRRWMAIAASVARSAASRWWRLLRL